MSGPTITIRRATGDDIAAMNNLMQTSSAYQGQYRSILDGYELTSAQIERDHVYVAEQHAKVLGIYSLIASSAAPELDLLFVSDTVQGCGIGTALIAHLKQLAVSLGISAIKIVSHPPALDFYVRMGAKIVGTSPANGWVTWERPVLTLPVMDLVFRETLPSDIEGLFSVRARTRENPISKEGLASIGVTAESIAQMMASGRMKGRVCLHESTLVGFCNGDAETGEVIVLAVLPDYERRGIGTYLLSRVVEGLRSVGSNTIWLAASPDARIRAHGFYRSLGWRPNGKKQQNGDEILVFDSDKTLPPNRTGAN
jgi:GNAT superfamily N-acetyltransferase